MAEVIMTGFACGDCACAIANGDTSGIDESDYDAWESGIKDVGSEGWGYAVITCGGDDSDDYDCDEWREDDCTHCGRNVYSTFHPVAYLD